MRQLRAIGFSSQKAGYCRDLAAGIADGSIDLDGLGDAGDEDARRALTAIRGVGPWTADVYLLFVLRRADVWPHGDRALVVSMAENLGLHGVPSYEEAAAMASSWSPWRAVAARMLWHAYLVGAGASAVTTLTTCHWATRYSTWVTSEKVMRLSTHKGVVCGIRHEER